MKIVYLADAISPHLTKWAEHFSKQGFEIDVISFRPSQLPGAKVHALYDSHLKTMPRWNYVFKANQVKRLVKQIKPDLVHAHFATSYGMLGAISGFHPFIISAWGSDIFDFPRKSFFHKRILEFNLSKADQICSTSKIMGIEMQKYTKKDVLITPFGVDCIKFRSEPLLKPKDKIIIGTIKTLEDTYGIHYLIEAFAIIVRNHPHKPIELHIGGEGSRRKHLEDLCRTLNITDKVRFLGRIPHNMLPNYYNTFSAAVFLSEHESFGVAALEAQACGVPVVVSNVGGLPEVVQDGVTGFIVPPKDPQSAATAIERILFDPDLQHTMSKEACNFVLNNYQWHNCAKVMENLYFKIVAC